MDKYLNVMERYSPNDGEKTNLDNNNVIIELEDLPKTTATLYEEDVEKDECAQYLAPKEVIVNRYIFKK